MKKWQSLMLMTALAISGSNPIGGLAQENTSESLVDQSEIASTQLENASESLIDQSETTSTQLETIETTSSEQTKTSVQHTNPSASETPDNLFEETSLKDYDADGLETEKNMSPEDTKRDLKKNPLRHFVLFDNTFIKDTDYFNSIQQRDISEDGKIKFIETIGNLAIDLAGKNDLYASVMIAQASLESYYGTSALGAIPNRNLFGIKWSENDKFDKVYFWTKEEVNGVMVDVWAPFRRYDSYADSLQDNINLLKNGLTWNKDFYRGTWKSETNSYRDATLYLTGRYATDSKYNTKLNTLIEKYNLTQYDTAPLHYEKVSLPVRLKETDVYIWDKPYKYPSYHSLGKASSRYKVGTDYQIKRQATTINGIYYEIEPNVWISRSAFQSLDKPAYSSINQDVRLVKGDVYSWNKPYNYFGYKSVGKAENSLNVDADYHITRQAKTSNGIYYEAKPNVWVHHSAFENLDKPTYSSINQDVRLVKGDVYSWNMPYNYFGYKSVGKAKNSLKVDADYHITRQAKTSNGIYYEAKPNVWVHHSAFENLDKPAYSSIKQDVRLVKGDVYSWNVPYNYFGYKSVGKAKNSLKVDADYHITRQAKTKNGIYYETIPNVWVSRSAFQLLDQSTISTVQLTAKLKKGNVYAWNKPYNYFGYKSVGKASSQLKVGTTYTIKKQAKTKNGIYYEAKPNVWVHKSAF